MPTSLMRSMASCFVRMLLQCTHALSYVNTIADLNFLIADSYFSTNFCLFLEFVSRIFFSAVMLLPVRQSTLSPN